MVGLKPLLQRDSLKVTKTRLLAAVLFVLFFSDEKIFCQGHNAFICSGLKSC